MCGDWRPASTAPRDDKPILMRLPDGEVCGGRRDLAGQFWRSHGDVGTPVEPDVWSDMPAEAEITSRLRYEPRKPRTSPF